MTIRYFFVDKLLYLFFINPVVAFNSVIKFIKPFAIQGQLLNQYRLLD